MLSTCCLSYAACENGRAEVSSLMTFSPDRPVFLAADIPTAHAGSQICVPKGCNKALNSSTSPAARSVAETGSSFTYGAYGSYGSRGSYGKKSVAAAYAPAKSKSSMSDTNKAKDAADYPLAPTSTLHSHSGILPISLHNRVIKSSLSMPSLCCS